MQKLENFKMKETLDQLDRIFIEIINNLTLLGKEYALREMGFKALRSLPKTWDMKVITMRESKDLSKMTPQESFPNLKAFEFEMNRRDSGEASISKSITLVVVENSREDPDDPTNEEFALLSKKFKRFMGRTTSNQKAYQ